MSGGGEPPSEFLADLKTSSLRSILHSVGQVGSNYQYYSILYLSLFSGFIVCVRAWGWLLEIYIYIVCVRVLGVTAGDIYIHSMCPGPWGDYWRYIYT